MEIVTIALTVKDKDGAVQLIMQGDFPDDCVAIFVKHDDYPRAKELLTQEKP